MNPHMNVYASLLNICKRFKDANPGYALEVMDFDASVDVNEYPQSSLIGIYQMDYSEDDTMIMCDCVFPVSTMATKDTREINEMAGALAMFIRSQTKHPFIDYASGQNVGLMVAKNGLSISPVTKTTNRQFKYVLQTFVFDRTTSFLPT